MHKTLILFSLVFWSLTVASRAADVPQIGGVVNVVEAKATVLVNGVPAIIMAVKKDGSGGRGFVITDWLENGTNKIALLVEPVDDRAKAELQIQNVATAKSVLSLKQVGEGRTEGTIEVEGLPQWAFSGAEPQAADAPGLSDAVTALHTAYKSGDVEAIVKLSAPFFADQKLIGGMSPEMFSQRAQMLFSAGELQPLTEVKTETYLGGKLFHVRNGDGDAPVRIEVNRNGTKGTMRTGEWWSKIDGAWQVVR